jgi:hypothetical protein
VYFCYIDESGNPESSGNTSHFVLAGICIPDWKWKKCEADISRIKKKYGLENTEIHTAWLLRRYVEQEQISGFDKMDYKTRRGEVERLRATKILALKKKGGNGNWRQVKKNYAQTAGYSHLTLVERKSLVEEIAKQVGEWGFARVFVDCIDKTYYDPAKHRLAVSEQAFEQVVSRFQKWLSVRNKDKNEHELGVLIHDNNQTVARKHTELMKSFHQRGTFWVKIDCIIETPLFVDSSLTSMVQIADLCSYAFRRYVENQEGKLFNLLLPRAYKARDGRLVSIRHFSAETCTCSICSAHVKKTLFAAPIPMLPSPKKAIKAR